MPGAKTMAKCVIGMARPVTISKNAIPLVTVDTVYDVATMEQTAFAPMIYVASLRIVRFTPLIPTLNAAIALPLMMTLTSKGC